VSPNAAVCHRYCGTHGIARHEDLALLLDEQGKPSGSDLSQSIGVDFDSGQYRRTFLLENRRYRLGDLRLQR